MESQKLGEWTKSTNICAVCENISLILAYTCNIYSFNGWWASTILSIFIEDCSCTDVTAKGYGQKIYGKCENEEVLDPYGRVVNTGWWIYGPLCYVNEPTTCPEARKYRPSSLNQMIFSWEACELNYSHMGKFTKFTSHYLMMRHSKVDIVNLAKFTDTLCV